MRVARGMFRLWLVLSLLYAAAVAIVYYRPIATEFEVATMLANVGPWTKFQADRPDFTPEQRQALENAQKRMLAGSKPNFFDQFDPSPHPWTMILATVKLAIIPPGVVLLIGFAFAWALAGFRRSPHS